MAAVEHENAVRVAHGREAVRDDERRAAGAQPAERGEHDLLGNGVEGGRRLVEDENRRVLDDRARDAQSLAFAAGQAAAGLGDFRIVAFGEMRDEFVRVRGPRGLLDLLGRRIQPSVTEVLGDRPLKQDRVLQHDRDLLAQRSHTVIPHVDAVDEHAARSRVVKPRNQTDERRLARARQANQRDHFAGLGREVDVVQDPGAVGVVEADALELDIARDRRGFNGIRRVDGFRRQREHRADAAGAGDRSLQLSRGVRDRRQRAIHHAQIRDDHRQLADGELVAHDMQAADDENQASRRLARLFPESGHLSDVNGWALSS